MGDVDKLQLFEEKDEQKRDPTWATCLPAGEAPSRWTKPPTQDPVRDGSSFSSLAYKIAGSFVNPSLNTLFSCRT